MYLKFPHFSVTLTFHWNLNWLNFYHFMPLWGFFWGGGGSEVSLQEFLFRKVLTFFLHLNLPGQITKWEKWESLKSSFRRRRWLLSRQVQKARPSCRNNYFILIEIRIQLSKFNVKQDKTKFIFLHLCTSSQNLPMTLHMLGWVNWICI